MKIACNKSERTVNMLKQKSGITLIALVVTIVLNCSFLAMVVKS